MLCWIQIQALLNPGSGFAEAGSRLCCIRIQDLLNPDPGYAESGSRLCSIRIKALLKPDTSFGESRSSWDPELKLKPTMDFMKNIWKNFQLEKICPEKRHLFVLNPLNRCFMSPASSLLKKLIKGSKDAGIEPRPLATLFVRRCNNSAWSHPLVNFVKVGTVGFSNQKENLKYVNSVCCFLFKTSCSCLHIYSMGNCF